MTPEEIDKLAKEFAKEYAAREYPNAPCEANYWIVEARTESMKENLRFLLRTHCIVSREKVAEIKENRYLKEYEFLTERCIEDLIPERTDWHDILRLCDGMYYALKQLLDETDK